LHKEDNNIENLRLDINLLPAPTQFAAVYVKQMFAEFVSHWRLPRPANTMVKEKLS
jgi:hypothetical protein